MKAILNLFFTILGFSVFSQTEFEQNLYDNKIDQVLYLSKTKIQFNNSKGNTIGFRTVSKKDTIYIDQFRRTLKIIPVKTNKTEQKVNNNSPKAKVNSSKKVGEPYIIKRRRKILFYDKFGELEMIARSNWKGNKITFRNNKNKRVGYKIFLGNGIVEYYDGARRKTGQSHINSSGRLIFEPFRQRITPSYLLQELHFE